MTRHALAPALVVALVVLAGAASTPAPTVDVVVTGVPRPLQLALDRDGMLVVLSPGGSGDSAAEIFRVPLSAGPPVDLSHAPRVRVPFAAGPRKAAFGSLAIDPRSGDLLLGEENGTRIYRLAAASALTLYARGLHRLGGGSTLAFDAGGRLLVVDYVDQIPPSMEEPGPPDFEWLRDEDYRGPLLFRIELDPDVRLPRDLGRTTPFFPRAWNGRAGGGLLPRLISVAVAPGGSVFALSSMGEVFRVSADSGLEPLARLPVGQYHRISMVAAPDGGVLVSGGLHLNRVFQVAGDGAVTTLAADLADPEGIAVDAAGYVYVAESALHRIVRFPAR